MSCKQWFSSALRQCRSALAQQQQVRSTSTASAASTSLRRLFPDSNSSNNSGVSERKTPSNPTEALHGLLSAGLERGGQLTAEEQRQMMEQQNSGRVSVRDLRMNNMTDNYLRQMPRRWRTGDVYSPRDLGSVEMNKWRTSRRPKKDILDVLGINPLDNYRNFALISEFVTPMGRIKHSLNTGLRPKNQRKMAKAIRRAIGMGLHPSVHRHPEILRLSRQNLSVSPRPTSTDPSQSFL